VVDGVIGALADAGIAHSEVGGDAPGQVRAAAQAEDARGEEAGVGLPAFAAVAFRVDGDEDRLQLVGALAEPAQHLAHVDRPRRTDVGAEGAAEGNQRVAAGKVAVADRSAIRPSQRHAVVAAHGAATSPAWVLSSQRPVAVSRA